MDDEPPRRFSQLVRGVDKVIQSNGDPPPYEKQWSPRHDETTRVFTSNRSNEYYPPRPPTVSSGQKPFLNVNW